MDDIASIIEKNLAKDFGITGVKARLKERAKQEEAQAASEAAAAQANVAEPEQAPQWLPIDIYRNNQRKIHANSKKEFPRGSRAMVKAITESIINGGGSAEGLARAKKRAEGDIELLKAQGSKDRADILKTQYMEEKFLPAIETVIDYTSPDEVLNCKEALKLLDSMALGTGSMSGYTAAYIRQAYGNELGKAHGSSDPSVETEMRRIRSLVSNDQMRTAIGLAQKLKKKVDNGEAMASPEDYAVIGRMVAYAN